MSDKDFDKINEFEITNGTLHETICDNECEKTVSVIEDDGFVGTYTDNVNDEEFDKLFNFNNEDEECEMDKKAIALIGVSALLASGALCYAFKKSKKKK